jgi:hypothetical protein
MSVLSNSGIGSSCARRRLESGRKGDKERRRIQKGQQLVRAHVVVRLI